MFTDVTQTELDKELLDEDRNIAQQFMDEFMDNEADALPVDVQVRRIIKTRLNQ